MSDRAELRNRLRRVVVRFNDGWTMDEVDRQSVADAIAYLSENQPIDAGVDFDPNQFGTGSAGDPDAPIQQTAQPVAQSKIDEVFRRVVPEGVNYEAALGWFRKGWREAEYVAPAVPREPTEKMLNAGMSVLPPPTVTGDEMACRAIWIAMHDAFTKSSG